jgi:hypothetical protein
VDMFAAWRSHLEEQRDKFEGLDRCVLARA